MKTIAAALLCVVFTFAACNKKTAPAASVPAPKPTEITEKKPATLDELKGKPVEVKQLPEDKALEMAKSKREAMEGNYKSYYDSGYEKHNSGDFGGAINDFSKSIELNPQYGDAYSFRGMSRYKSGDKPGACADWKRAAELGSSTAAEMVQRNCQ